VNASAQPPLVSIVMPAYNAQAYLAAAIRSALGQTWPRVEVIVVNDGSRDDTLGVARSFTDPRVLVLDQENRGAAAARNVGLRAAQGEFVQYLDADDLIAPDKVQLQVQRLTGQTDCVAAGRWGRFHDDPAKAWFVPEPFWRDLNSFDWVVSRWERSSMMHPAGWLIPRPVLERAGGWDETLTLDDDGEYFGRVALASRTVLFCEGAVSFYRSGLPGSLSGTTTDRGWTSQHRSVVLTATRLLAAEDSARVRRACSRGFEEFVYACYPAVPELRRQAWLRVRELGGPYFRPQMGRRLQLLSWVVGWKLAKRLQAIGRRLGRVGRG
jgi:GT2 family glycosyltransferase